MNFYLEQVKLHMSNSFSNKNLKVVIVHTHNIYK
jgi:hypothetical protein